MIEQKITEFDGYNILEIAGRIDSITSPEIERQLNVILDTGLRNILINIQNVIYISSAGLRVFLVFQKQLTKAGGQIIFLGVSKPIFDVFEMGGFSQLFKFYLSIKDYVSKCQKLLPVEEKINKTCNNINLEILEVKNNISGSFFSFGDPKKVNFSSFTSDDVISVNPNKIKYGVGLGGFGENYDEYKEYFGEALVINNNLYFYPAVKNSAVDYLLYSEKSNDINYQFFHGFGFNGQPDKIIGFASTDEFTTINNLIEAVFCTVKSNLLGVVLLAESKGFWGMNLKKVPIIENKPNNGTKIFDNNNIFDWINYPVEPADFDNIILGVGIVRRNTKTEIKNAEGLFNQESILHIHGAVFEKGIISNDTNLFEDEIKRIINEFQILKVQHILSNSLFNRGLIGIVELGS
ncbi:MAG: STAS domain-containing protein [bacterium]